MEGYVEAAADAECCFCHVGGSEENELTLGKLYQLDDIVTHYYCLLLSSNMDQQGKDDEGILGFLHPDITKECNRGKRLTCVYCKKNGATISCCSSKCKKVFHLPCGQEKGSLHQFFGQFKSFCPSHRPLQKIPPKVLEAFIKDPKECSICAEDVDPKSVSGTIWAPCCKISAWFHRLCLQKLAISSGYFFKCPLCADRKDFLKTMTDFGIFMPEQDASWELEPGAFSEQLERYNTCDAPVCKCPTGRKWNAKGTRFELILCSYCGGQASHIFCSQLKWVNPKYACATCYKFADDAADCQISPEHSETYNDGEDENEAVSKESDDEPATSPLDQRSLSPVRQSEGTSGMATRAERVLDSVDKRSAPFQAQRKLPTLKSRPADEELIVCLSDSDDEVQVVERDALEMPDGSKIPVLRFDIPFSRGKNLLCLGDPNVQTRTSEVIDLDSSEEDDMITKFKENNHSVTITPVKVAKQDVCDNSRSPRTPIPTSRVLTSNGGPRARKSFQSQGSQGPSFQNIQHPSNVTNENLPKSNGSLGEYSHNFSQSLTSSQYVGNMSRMNGAQISQRTSSSSLQQGHSPLHPRSDSDNQSFPRSSQDHTVPRQKPSIPIETTQNLLHPSQPSLGNQSLVQSPQRPLIPRRQSSTLPPNPPQSPRTLVGHRTSQQTTQSPTFNSLGKRSYPTSHRRDTAQNTAKSSPYEKELRRQSIRQTLPRGDAEITQNPQQYRSNFENSHQSIDGRAKQNIRSSATVNVGAQQISRAIYMPSGNRLDPSKRTQASPSSSAKPHNFIPNLSNSLENVTSFVDTANYFPDQNPPSYDEATQYAYSASTPQRIVGFSEGTFVPNMSGLPQGSILAVPNFQEAQRLDQNIYALPNYTSMGVQPNVVTYNPEVINSKQNVMVHPGGTTVVTVNGAQSTQFYVTTQPHSPSVVHDYVRMIPPQYVGSSSPSAGKNGFVQHADLRGSPRTNVSRTSSNLATASACVSTARWTGGEDRKSRSGGPGVIRGVVGQLVLEIIGPMTVNIHLGDKFIGNFNFNWKVPPMTTNDPRIVCAMKEAHKKSLSWAHSKKNGCFKNHASNVSSVTGRAPPLGGSKQRSSSARQKTQVLTSSSPNKQSRSFCDSTENTRSVLRDRPRVLRNLGEYPETTRPSPKKRRRKPQWNRGVIVSKKCKYTRSRSHKNAACESIPEQKNLTLTFAESEKFIARRSMKDETCRPIVHRRRSVSCTLNSSSLSPNNLSTRSTRRMNGTMTRSKVNMKDLTFKMGAKNEVMILTSTKRSWKKQTQATSPSPTIPPKKSKPSSANHEPRGRTSIGQEMELSEVGSGAGYKDNTYCIHNNEHHSPDWSRQTNTSLSEARESNEAKIKSCIPNLSRSPASSSKAPTSSGSNRGKWSYKDGRKFDTIFVGTSSLSGYRQKNVSDDCMASSDSDDDQFKRKLVNSFGRHLASKCLPSKLFVSHSSSDSDSDIYVAKSSQGTSVHLFSNSTSDSDSDDSFCTVETTSTGWKRPQRCSSPDSIGSRKGHISRRDESRRCRPCTNETKISGPSPAATHAEDAGPIATSMGPYKTRGMTTKERSGVQVTPQKRPPYRVEPIRTRSRSLSDFIQTRSRSLSLVRNSREPYKRSEIHAPLPRKKQRPKKSVSSYLNPRKSHSMSRVGISSIHNSVHQTDFDNLSDASSSTSNRVVSLKAQALTARKFRPPTQQEMKQKEMLMKLQWFDNSSSFLAKPSSQCDLD